VQAVETGRIAGANAAGEEIEYEAIGSSMVIDAFDTGIFALGSNGKDPDKEFRAVDKSEGDNYEKYYFFEGKLAGVILVGDISKMGVLTQKVAEKASYEEMFG
jgi:NAD(P)H-nitrite reductase large subunit